MFEIFLKSIVDQMVPSTSNLHGRKTIAVKKVALEGGEFYKITQCVEEKIRRMLESNRATLHIARSSTHYNERKNSK